MVGKFFPLLFIPLYTASALSQPEEIRLTALYSSLPPHSLSQHLLFSFLYPHSAQGERALNDAWHLLLRGGVTPFTGGDPISLLRENRRAFISLIRSPPLPAALSARELQGFERVTSHLTNRRLRGFHIWDTQSLVDLPPEEVDLARALLLYRFGGEDGGLLEVRQYEAILDCIALQILALLPKEATPEEKICAINTLLFYEKGFRYPPYAQSTREVDLYTMLPSVLDRRLGICLGTCTLYLAIAQRIDLPLEILTPPGHIYLRHRTAQKSINIETTERGVSLPTTSYLDIDTRRCRERNLKEVIGLTLINLASVPWNRGEYKTSLHLYEKARLFLPTDPQLKLLLGYNYLFIGKTRKGVFLLREVLSSAEESGYRRETTPEDFLQGRIDCRGIRTLYTRTEANRSSLVKKREQLEKVIERYPLFREGHLELASIYLQLHREREALRAFNSYHRIDPNNPTVEYSLASLYTKRLRYREAWQYLRNAEALTSSGEEVPQCLKDLRHLLRKIDREGKPSPHATHSSK